MAARVTPGPLTGVLFAGLVYPVCRYQPDGKLYL